MPSQKFPIATICTALLPEPHWLITFLSKYPRPPISFPPSGEHAKMTRLAYPQWQEPLAAAILEFNPQTLIVKLKRAEQAITARIEQLPLTANSAHERRMLSDGLAIIETLRKNRLASSEAKAV
jgi:hypothetical protein